MRLKVLNIEDVVSTQLCCGCGACASVEPDRYEMVDDLDLGRRPVLRADRANGHADAARLAAGEAMRVCPGHRLEHHFDRGDPGLVSDLTDGWGPVRGLWEGYAGDGEIRFAGSSGGAASALALFCLEHERFHGVLHTAAREDAPYLNETVMSRTRAELLGRTGSRYAPASPCDGLATIENASGPCVFIGKPCDVAAARNARAVRPKLEANLELTVAFFCAGTPSTRGTLELLKTVGVDDPDRVRRIRYRGRGWPGRWMVEFEGPHGLESRDLSYEESWDFLQRYRQWRCYVCPDHTGEFADVAVGDPWYREIQPNEHGSSLIVARTERGREAIEGAIAAGYLKAHRVPASLLPRSQPNLLRTRGSLWGRLIALRAFGAGVPVFRRMPLFRWWVSRLSAKQKLQSIAGTAKRVFRKGLRKPVRVSPRREPARPREAAAVRASIEPDRVGVGVPR